MAKVLSEISDSLAETVERVGVEVVRLEGRDRLAASGVAWSEDIVATAHHVVGRDDEIRVGLTDGTTAPAALVGRDPTTDLAALRIEAGGLTPP